MHYYKNEINTSLSHFVIDCNASALQSNQDWIGDPGIGLPDPVAMAIAIEPEICINNSQHYVEIECNGEFTRGMTIVDQLGVTTQDTANGAMWQSAIKRDLPQITVCWEIDVIRWKALLELCVRKQI